MFFSVADGLSNLFTQNGFHAVDELSGMASDPENMVIRLVDHFLQVAVDRVILTKRVVDAFSGRQQVLG